MNTKLVLAVGMAGVILLVTGTSVISLVKVAFARLPGDPNPDNNGQFLAPGLSENHRNPSGGEAPPGQHKAGNPGQCQKGFDDHDICHQQ